MQKDTRADGPQEERQPAAPACGARARKKPGPRPGKKRDTQCGARWQGDDWLARAREDLAGLYGEGAHIIREHDGGAWKDGKKPGAGGAPDEGTLVKKTTKTRAAAPVAPPARAHKGGRGKGIEWDAPENLQRLKTESVKVLAEAFGVSEQAVYHARKVRGIRNPSATCKGRLEWHQLQGIFLSRDTPDGNVYDYRCPACGVSGAASKPREVCGHPLNDQLDAAAVALMAVGVRAIPNCEGSGAYVDADAGSTFNCRHCDRDLVLEVDWRLPDHAPRVDDELLAACGEGRLTPAEDAAVIERLTGEDRAALRDLFSREVPAPPGERAVMVIDQDAPVLGGSQGRPVAGPCPASLSGGPHLVIENPDNMNAGDGICEACGATGLLYCRHPHIVPNPDTPGDGLCEACSETGFPMTDDFAGLCNGCGTFDPDCGCTDPDCDCPPRSPCDVRDVDHRVLTIFFESSREVELLDELVTTGIYGDTRGSVAQAVLVERLRAIALAKR